MWEAHILHRPPERGCGGAAHQGRQVVPRQGGRRIVAVSHDADREVQGVRVGGRQGLQQRQQHGRLGAVERGQKLVDPGEKEPERRLSSIRLERLTRAGMLAQQRQHARQCAPDLV